MYHDNKRPPRGGFFCDRSDMTIYDRDWYKEASKERDRQLQAKPEPPQPKKLLANLNAVLTWALAVYGGFCLARDVMRWLHL